MDNSLSVTELERGAMQMLLAGEHPVLAVLRVQFDRGKLVQRELTGVGFFAHFEIPPDVPRVPGRRSLELGDVHADIPGLSLGVDFILFIREGAIDFLEGFTYADDRWPETIEHYSLCYTKKFGVNVVRADQRNWEAITKQLEGP